MQDHNLRVLRSLSARVVGAEGAGRDGHGFWMIFRGPSAYICP